ncbi:MAG: DsbA family protein [Candidatus Micrarchaeota archaeon]|nr:DsbA family protein [Candidatus Micrarchaeota archaeon]
MSQEEKAHEHKHTEHKQEGSSHMHHTGTSHVSKPQKEGGELVDNVLVGFLGLFVLGFMILVGLIILSNSISDLSKSINTYAESNQKMIKELTSDTSGGKEGLQDGSEKKDTNVPQPTNTKKIVVNDATFEYVDLSGLDLSKAAGKIEVENPKLVIVEFTDIQCPFCRRFWGDSGKFLKENYVKKGLASYYVFDFPLSFHQDAANMSNAARCAGEQGKYFEMFDKLFAYQDTQGSGTVRVSSEKISELAKEIGLDMNKFNECQTAFKYQKQIYENMNYGIAVGVQGTPAIFVNGYMIPGAYPSSYVKGLVEKILAQ